MENLEKLAQSLAASALEVRKEMQERDVALKEREEKFYETKRIMEERNKITDTILNLNVGGTPFTTYKTTLCKYEGTMLEAMFSGRHPTTKDSEGRFFLDRPADAFKTILVFLQTGKFHWPKNEGDREILKEELVYYGLHDLIVGNLLMDSAIIGQQTVDFLADCGIISARLLYRRSKDGGTPAIFHQLCDNKGPTLTIIKTQSHIFGGYTEKSWTNSSFLFPSPSAWLFSLVQGNHNKYKPTFNAGVFTTPSAGPYFGDYDGHCVLGVALQQGMCVLAAQGFGFEAPAYLGVAQAQIPLVEVEVFQVTTLY